MPQEIDRSSETADQLNSAVLEEYRALYGLLTFRLQAVERRVPLIGASLAGLVSALHALDGPDRMFLLWAVPIALIWFLRTTINHARSLEDLLRRIEEIEHSVNRRLGEKALCFQSSHPSRTLFVGGRTSNESVLAVLLWSFLLLGGLAYINSMQTPERWVFDGYLIAVSFALIGFTRRYARYAYRSTDTD